MAKKLIDILIPEAYRLAASGAIEMPAQDRFAKTYLTDEQSTGFISACVQHRENRLPIGQPLLDAIVEALTGEPN